MNFFMTSLDSLLSESIFQAMSTEYLVVKRCVDSSFLIYFVVLYLFCVNYVIAMQSLGNSFFLYLMLAFLDIVSNLNI